MAWYVEDLQGAIAQIDRVSVGRDLGDRPRTRHVAALRHAGWQSTTQRLGCKLLADTLIGEAFRTAACVVRVHCHDRAELSVAPNVIEVCVRVQYGHGKVGELGDDVRNLSDPHSRVEEKGALRAEHQVRDDFLPLTRLVDRDHTLAHGPHFEPVGVHLHPDE